jgi:Circularly permuted ATP-grasp type 2
MLRDPKQRQHVFNNLHNLVVKEVQGSGGYGMLIGPASTAEEREAYKLRVMQNPENYIAQPTLALSTAPTLIDGAILDCVAFLNSARERASRLEAPPHFMTSYIIATQSIEALNHLMKILICGNLLP